ncbi:putative PHP domain protein [Treponema primitia ZAS-2]|uniref:Putative PHP domain protein n=1 Tax=Treponema primitia (strain ATCC BAA-887 / DSM 12427 / ZAS-2) TaxID=545694 RepID=F5YMG6_TREPZ|nr:PHP domain-containing protein [Treponema primitia]AEF84448.1 putative PHP domain protein [Treponema primitia ZAS-2]
MQYLYETHLHTVQSSSCGESDGRSYIRGYKDLGYTGIIVTDHFFNGNSAINRHLPWREWVNRFCQGYEDTLDEGEKQGLDVFFGWEETFEGDDYLIYGLDKDWLLDHPEAARWTRLEQFNEVRRYGGCVVQAHPFRHVYYIDTVHLSTGCVDAVEAANAGNASPAYDAAAKRYAGKLGLPVTAGSDIHNCKQIKAGQIFGVYLDKKLDTIQDYVRAIREHTITGLRIPQGRCDFFNKKDITLPVDIRDADDRSTRQSLWDFLER